MKKRNNAFTLTELLTAIGIVAVLIAILLPSLSKVRAVGYNIKQKGQLSSLDVALEVYRNDFGAYPSSSNKDSDGQDYYGSEKLAEALLGYDLLGVHKDVRPNFDKNGEDDGDNSLYVDGGGKAKDLDKRKGPYLEVDKLKPIASGNSDDMYDLAAGGNYISDVYIREGLKTGMAVLYYKARPEKGIQNWATVNDKVYDYRDSNMKFKAGLKNEKLDYSRGFNYIWGDDAVAAEDNFDDFIINKAISNGNKIPYRAQSFILISAGADGIYGTDDDVTNFER